MTQPSLFDAGPPARPLLTPLDLARHLAQPFAPTPEQCHAIAAPLRPHLVVAGAGSGKTQTMGLRVVWLVANGLVEPHRVLGLTFTRKAAAELGERVRRMLAQLRRAHEAAHFLSDDVAAALRTGEPTVTTYHAYAGGLVAEHALRIGLEPDLRLVGEAVSWQYAARVVESYDGDMTAVDRAAASVTADVLGLAGELSEHLREPADIQALTEAVCSHLDSLPRGVAQRGASVPAPVLEFRRCLEARLALLPMVGRYAELKRSRGVIDYGDQVAVAARISQGHPEVGEIERSRFGAVLLDEYQDTGEAQRVLLTSLFGRGHPVTAVGDPRQSIYGWRGASAGNLERFGADFEAVDPGPAQHNRDEHGHPPEPDPSQTGLTVSFRNGQRILDVANLVAAGLPLRHVTDRPLRPGRGRTGRNAGRVVVALHESVTDEAMWIADRIASLGQGVRPASWGGVAVLARKRSSFPRLEAELRARGVPCEVVGLGGLLSEPAVIDVVATLRVLADPGAGGALVRLLTGPRWRLGPRDLDALGRRARRLSAGIIGVPPRDDGSVAEVGGAHPDAEGAVRPATRVRDIDAVDDRSLVDALDDLGDPRGYSAVGYGRLVALRDELRGLRRLTSTALPDLVSAVVRALGLDVELAARPGVSAIDASIDLDRLVEVAEDFAAAGEDPGLVAFLAYLDTAEERERGLETDVAEPDADRVQLMTVHAAKGLEWDSVFVAGMTRGVFPVEGQPVASWTRQLAALPFPLRGDRDELPTLGWDQTDDQVGAKDELVTFRTACEARAALEERRLAYVAVTRARSLLVCSGFWWDTTVKRRGPSDLLTEIHDLCVAGGDVALWADPPAEDATNPLTAEPARALWPYDPLGARRPAVAAAAAMVRAAAEPGGSPDGPMGTAGRVRVDGWDRDLALLVAELDRDHERGTSVVELPDRLSVSQLVALRRDPAELARTLRRPMPRAPAPNARRGTRFHLWLEQRWGQQRLLDVDELPGAADDTAAPDADLVALQEAFRRSDWWHRVPAEVELPFEMVVDGVLLRGRCDAVFDDSLDGMVDVVDWKTGPPAAAGDAESGAVQLAAYRLAWHHLSGTPLDRIRAAFHHVGVNQTIRPADLLDGQALVDLVRSVPTR